MKFVEMVCNYLDNFFFLEVVQNPWMNIAQGNSHVTEKQVLQGNLQILKDAIFYSPKNPIITYFKSS